MSENCISVNTYIFLYLSYLISKYNERASVGELISSNSHELLNLFFFRFSQINCTKKRILIKQKKHAQHSWHSYCSYICNYKALSGFCLKKNLTIENINLLGKPHMIHVQCTGQRVVLSIFYVFLSIIFKKQARNHVYTPLLFCMTHNGFYPILTIFHNEIR